MLIESEGYQAKELSQIQASKVTMVYLQKSLRKEEREGGTHRSSAGGNGTVANVQRKVRSPSNVTEERGGGGGVVDEDVGRRRASAPGWSRSTAVQVLCSSVRR
jgi:hypothetical protein